MDAKDECNITEIEVLPDGRVCVFGTSAEVLAVLQGLDPDENSPLARRLRIQMEHKSLPAPRGPEREEASHKRT
ncbi:MAG: hypothetical protein RJP95_02875 [Pirellulales bacterium]